MTREEVAKLIDHTALNPQLHRKAIIRGIQDCKDFNFGGICLDPGWIGLAKKHLPNTRIITVPNWSVGGGLEHSRNIDIAYSEADEVDYIISTLSSAILRNREATTKELAKVRTMIRGTMRVIIEATVIRAFAEKDKKDFETEIKEICGIVEQSGADWIKTDSGLYGRKAPEHLFEDIVLMRRYCKLPLKAAAGIKTLDTLQKCVKLGASQIGSSSGTKILEELIKAV
jgi:deoxyribose-phosphate aldolase